MRIFRWFRTGLLVFIAGGLMAYGGACVWANWIAGDGKTEPPAVSKAAYAVQIKGTGQVLFSNKVVERGIVVVLYGYYEYDGKKFLYRKQTLPMDETLFGEIRVVKREVPAQ